MAYFKISTVTAEGVFLEVHTAADGLKQAKEFAQTVTEEDNKEVEKLFAQHWYLRRIMSVSYGYTGITRQEIQQAYLEGITRAYYTQKSLNDYCLPGLCLNCFNDAVKKKVKEIE